MSDNYSTQGGLMFKYWTISLSFISALAMTIGAVAAEKQYSPGASDTEIKIGQTMAYSGPASAYGVLGKAEAAYVRMINAQGGINGRKITLISLDDGYSPPKTLEQTRRLVEVDQVSPFSTVLERPEMQQSKIILTKTTCHISRSRVQADSTIPHDFRGRWG